MKKEITISEKYGPAMEITDQAEADKYFEECVAHGMSFDRTREEAVNIEKQNLGYYSGYYSHEVMERVQQLFSCQHPVFGLVKPTTEQAFKAGVERGKTCTKS